MTAGSAVHWVEPCTFVKAGRLRRRLRCRVEAARLGRAAQRRALGRVTDVREGGKAAASLAMPRRGCPARPGSRLLPVLPAFACDGGKDREAPRTTLPALLATPETVRRTGSESVTRRARTRRCRV